MDIDEIYEDSLFIFGAIISAPLWLPIVVFAFIIFRQKTPTSTGGG